MMDCSDESSRSHPIDTFFDACRNGRTLLVAATLIEMPKERRNTVLTLQSDDENNQLFSPFLIAVRNGHFQLVRLLLTMFYVNPNSECHVGNVNFDSYLVEGATPLWCAAAIDSFELVELLVDHGAEINKCTLSKSTPLRAACFSGSMRIVQYLIERNADMTIANRYQNTCLMVAAYRGHYETVEYLLDKGADPNLQANCGGTALHFCVDGSQIDIAKLLVRKGCDVCICNSNGMSAPVYAADACYTDMIEFFISLPAIGVEHKINLLELLGASFANDKDHYDIEKTYHYFYLAMLMRSKENIRKEIQALIPAYGRLECGTLEELQAIRNDSDALHMEALVVRERILGENCVELPYPVIYRGAVYADMLAFNRSISLWQHALELKQKNFQLAHVDLYRFAEVFSQMVSLREEIEVQALVNVLYCCLHELHRTRDELKKLTESPEVESSYSRPGNPKVTAESLQSQLEGNVHVMLYLLNIVTKSTVMRDSYECGKFTYQFVKSDFRDRNGRSPLHLVLDERTPVDDFHVKDVCAFPNSDVAQFMLMCGADPDSVCNKGNTPLHVIVQYAKPISDFMTLHTAITDLLEAGAHPDVRNKKDESPLDIATTGVAEIILKKESKWTLSCLAARVVSKHNIAYVGQVPVTLEKFIEMH